MAADCTVVELVAKIKSSNSETERVFYAIKFERCEI